MRWHVDYVRRSSRLGTDLSTSYEGCRRWSSSLRRAADLTPRGPKMPVPSTGWTGKPAELIPSLQHHQATWPSRYCGNDAVALMRATVEASHCVLPHRRRQYLGL